MSNVSPLNILSNFYQILNVSEITDFLNGGAIYKDARPTNSEKNDIVINVNFLKSKYKTGVNYGLANINIYCLSDKDGYADYVFFENIYKKIIERFEQINYNLNSFYFSIEDTSIQQELNQNDLFYINIRLNIQHN